MRMRGGERGIANAYEKDRSNNATGLFRHRIEKQFVRQRRYFKILHRVSTRGCSLVSLVETFARLVSLNVSTLLIELKGDFI